MTDTPRYDQLAARVKALYPRFNTKPRNKSWLMPIFYVLGAITGTDYSTFHTTIFSTMYTGPHWDDMSDKERYKLLRHEMEHIRQAHEFPLGRWAWPVNHFLWAMCYLLVLPLGWTLRAKFEREGYLQTMLVQYELDGPIDPRWMEYNAQRMARTFGTSVYLFMWSKKKAYAWAMKVQREINAGKITNKWDRVILPGDEYT